MTKKKLPVLSKPVPAALQRELSVKPVAAGTRPEFPTRLDLYRRASLLGGATLLAGGMACSTPATTPPPVTPQQVAAPQPAPVEEAPAPPSDQMVAEAPPPPDSTLVQAPQQAKPAPPEPTPSPEVTGPTIDGQPIAKTAPKFPKVYRDGGGIGPAEDMWEESEVEAYINWTMAKEGKLNIQTSYKFDFEGVSFTMDGFDPEKNVGYEYVDKHDYDEREVFTKEVRAKFDKWMKQKKVAILFIEIKRNPDASTIKGKVLRFLSAVKRTPPATGKLAGATPEMPAAPNAPAKPIKQ